MIILYLYLTCFTKSIESAIDSIMARGGNYLLNVGPDEKGHISKKSEIALKEIGRWYNNVSESYLGAEIVDIGIQSSVNDFIITKPSKVSPVDKSESFFCSILSSLVLL